MNGKRSFFVVPYGGNTWVMHEDKPVLWFEGTSDEVHERAEKAAGLLGIRLAHERNGRPIRVQVQTEYVRQIPGVHIWHD